MTTISCSSALDAPPQKAQAQPAPLLQAKIADLAGDKIEYVALRVAKPRATLVFENGLMLDLKTWEGVAQRLNNCCDLLLSMASTCDSISFTSGEILIDCK